MSDGRIFTGSIPDFYDRYMVPLIFERHAQDMAQRVISRAPRSVLETAAGTGVVTRALDAKLDPGIRLVVTDLNEPMIEHARRRHGDTTRIEWCQADALDLPFEAATFDVVFCQFGVMFFPDKTRGYSEARRVLNTGGCFLFSVWDKIATNEFADVVTTALCEMFPDDPPDFMRKLPHGYFDEATIRADLSRAGFFDVTIETIETTSQAPDARSVALALCQGTPMRTEIESRGDGLLAVATDCAEAAIAARFGPGPVSGKICAHVVTALR